MKVRVWAVA